MAEWNVYYDSFFFADLQKPKTQNSGVEVSINKTFLWGAEEWKVLSMHLGLVRRQIVSVDVQTLSGIEQISRSE